MKNYISEFNFWKTSPYFDAETKNELASLDEINDAKEDDERPAGDFYQPPGRAG